MQSKYKINIIYNINHKKNLRFKILLNLIYNIMPPPYPSSGGGLFWILFTIVPLLGQEGLGVLITLKQKFLCGKNMHWFSKELFCILKITYVYNFFLSPTLPDYLGRK